MTISLPDCDRYVKRVAAKIQSSLIVRMTRRKTPISDLDQLMRKSWPACGSFKRGGRIDAAAARDATTPHN
jgi:hypothetical protein